VNVGSEKTINMHSLRGVAFRERKGGRQTEL